MLYSPRKEEANMDFVSHFKYGEESVQHLPRQVESILLHELAPYISDKEMLDDIILKISHSFKNLDEYTLLVSFFNLHNPEEIKFL